MKKPVICYLSDYSPEAPGSFIDSLLSLSQYCRARMHIEAFCVFPERAKGRVWIRRLESERVLYGFIPRSRSVIHDVRSLLESYDPLIFHTQFDLYDLSAIFLKLLFYKNAKVIWHFQSMSQLTLQQRLKDIFKVMLLGNRFGDRFISVGKEVYTDALIRGYRSDKLELIYNSIATDRFVANGEKCSTLRESLGISQEHIVFLLLGWSPIRKGVDIFIRAAEELSRKSNQKALFMIVGRNETRDFVSSLAQSPRLGPFLRLIEPVDDFSLLLHSVNVLVSSSRSEGFSYAILEAMAAGRLILSSDIAGVRETLGQARGAWLFPSEDWKMLSELMGKVLSLSPVERKALGQANSQYVEMHFSLDNWTEQIGGIYKTLLGEQG